MRKPAIRYDTRVQVKDGLFEGRTGNVVHEFRFPLHEYLVKFNGLDSEYVWFTRRHLIVLDAPPGLPVPWRERQPGRWLAAIGHAFGAYLVHCAENVLESAMWSPPPSQGYASATALNQLELFRDNHEDNTPFVGRNAATLRLIKTIEANFAAPTYTPILAAPTYTPILADDDVPAGDECIENGKITGAAPSPVSPPQDDDWQCLIVEEYQ